MVQVVVIWGLTALACTAIAGVLALIKNRDVSWWMAWSFLVPPMVLILFFVPRQDVRPKRPSLDEQDAAEA
jgi:hypothetical protein